MVLSNLPSWAIFLLVASATLQLLFLIQKSKLKSSYESNQLDSERLTQRLNHQSKNRLIGFLIVIAITINWAYQDDKNLKNAQSIFKEELLELSGNGWCLNNKVEKDGVGGFNTYGGWPCITIGGVSNVKFESDKKSVKGCAYVAFDRELGNIDDDLYQKTYKIETFCVSRGFSEFSISKFENEIYAFVKPELETLKAGLCSRYRATMDIDDQIYYC
jgi:hypothetical protein